MRGMPQTPQYVYWWRRAMVLVLAVMLVSGTVWLVTTLAGDEPAASPSSAATRTPEPGPTSPNLANPSPVGAVTPGGTHAAPAPVGTAPAGTAPAASVAPGATNAAASSRKSAGSATSPVGSAAAASTAACASNQVVVSVGGPSRVKVGSQADLLVTMANSGQQACVLSLTAVTFRLVITSGTDEVWSTRDCPTWGPEGVFTVQPGESVDWRMSWQRRRSQNGCRLVPSDLGAGTYVATAQLSGGTSGRHVMTLVW